jgi:5'-3' exonuclease
MGIPSYYKKLIGTVPGLVSKGYPESTISWLFMDFNCLIYHCLHREDTPVYPGPAEKDTWESAFLECVVTYCLKVIKQVKPTKGAYIAIDGVVPMAKMRQQRLRRFKSIWLTQHAGQGGEEKESKESKETWDRNAITPGTLFMGKLRKQLEGMISKHGKKTWKLSSSDEPGEGEHKLIREWRTGKYEGNYAVYGLDADLIVLSMLGHETASLGDKSKNKIWLFREEVQAGKIAYDAAGEEEFEWFSVSALTEWLCGDKSVGPRQFVLDYCFAMSVLGNDFLPSSLGLKIREDGHGELLDVLARLHQQGGSLVDQETLSLRTEGLVELFRLLAVDEEQRITKYVSKKQYASRNLVGSEGKGNCAIGDNDWPMYHMEEDVLLGTGRKLVEDWQSVYLTRFFPGFHASDKRKICGEYLYGIQWIWAYYTGRHADVCYDWCYSFSLPPLWSWIHGHLVKEGGLPAFPEQVLVRADDILPVEQLALVLPLESWSLLPPCPQRALPYLAPHLFPASFSFDSVGKRFFWECESLIPLPSIEAIKRIVASAPPR